MTKSITAAFADPSSAPLDDYVAVTPADADLPDGPCRAIIVDADGTLDLTTMDGVERDGVPVFKGLNPLCASRVRAATGPTEIWAGY